MAILEIVKECANRAIRYESHFDKAVSLGENLISKSNQNHSQYMIKAKRLTSWFDQNILDFEEEILNKVNFEELTQPPKKGGFFSNLFSGDQKEAKEEKEEEIDIFKRKKIVKNDYDKILPKEENFVNKVKNEAKLKIEKINDMIEDDLVLRDTAKFEFDSNYLSEVIEENPLSKFKGKKISLKNRVY